MKSGNSKGAPSRSLKPYPRASPQRRPAGERDPRKSPLYPQEQTLADHQVQIVDISNAPFARPDLDALTTGLEFIKNPANNYPIRGTYKAA